MRYTGIDSSNACFFRIAVRIFSGVIGKSAIRTGGVGDGALNCHRVTGGPSFFLLHSGERPQFISRGGGPVGDGQ